MGIATVSSAGRCMFDGCNAQRTLKDKALYEREMKMSRIVMNSTIADGNVR